MNGPKRRVECYAGHRGDEEPRRFVVGGREIEVREILRRWQEPGKRGFLVEGDDGRRYRLVCGESAGNWSIEPESV